MNHTLANHVSQPSFDASPQDALGRTFGNFDLVKKVKLDFTDVVVSKWRSRVTGLSVVHLDYDAPIMNGYLVFATEIFDDSGCPHTLEHLVFMGSEKYPYKGIIDHLANRGFSNGTNAWTDTDHTAYTVSTAGEQGFLQILPIFVDHVLYPTITKASFITEVHHITGEGRDSGVVYSEMQGRQNTSADLMALSTQRLLNPPGSAYRSETGGLMEALRVLTIDQIRDYHRSYYIPHNMLLVAAGKFSSGTSALLATVQDKVEPSLIAHGQNLGPRPPGWKRPFVETPSSHRIVPPKMVHETVEFPERDETVGELTITFMGPPLTQYLERQALDVLGTYLTSSAVAPLNKEYIEIDTPLCTYFYFGEDTRASLVDLPVYVGSVPTEILHKFPDMLKASLQRIVKGGIDMKRMAMVIRRDERQLRSKLESSKGDTFSGTIISDFLYGAEDGSELKDSMDEISQYATLKQWSGQQWADLLQKYYIDPNGVVVCGKPSAALAEKLEKDEVARISNQVERLGPEGLKQAELDLQEAKAEHDRPIPPDILTLFPIPDVKTISWIPVQSFVESGRGRGGGQKLAGQSALERHVTKDGEPLPFFVQYDHVQSDFVTVQVLFSLAKLPDRLRPYIPVYLSSFFSLPMKKKSGEQLTHEDVVNMLDDETVQYGAGLGIAGRFPENLRIAITVEKEAYPQAVAWIRDLVYGSKFDIERLQVTVAKKQQSIPEMKRDGQIVLGSMFTDVFYGENSTSRAGVLRALAEFLPKISKQLQESPDEVVAALEELRGFLTDPSGVRFSLTGNILGLEKPRSVLGDHFRSSFPETELTPVSLVSDTLSSVGKNPTRLAVLTSLATIESSYVIHTAKGVHGFDHPEYPALRVAGEILNATEGFLWRSVRGLGLAYTVFVGVDVEAGHVNFTLARSSNSVQAFQEAANVVKGLADGSVNLDEPTIEAAKSSIVYNVAKNVSTPSRAALVSFTDQAMKGVSKDYQAKLLEKCQSVTKEDILSVTRKYYIPLFDPEKSIAVVVATPAKVDHIEEGLKSVGFEVERRELGVDGDEDLVDGSGSGSGSGGSESGSERE